MPDHNNTATLCATHLHVAREESMRLRDDDALSECYVVLVEAAASWDPTRGLTFEEWARRLMRTRVRRRIMDKRIIHVPWRVRQQLADTMTALEGSGSDITAPSIVKLPRTIMNAAWATRPVSMSGVEEAVRGVVDPPERPPHGMSWSLLLRYGFDGGGMRSAREVSALTGVSAEEVLLEEAEFLERHGVRSPVSAEAESTGNGAASSVAG